MSGRHLLLLGLAGFTLGLAIAGEPTPKTAQYSQKALLKNWALSRCLGQAYGAKKVEEDANRTAGAYFEFSRVSVERFEALSALVDRYLHADYRGSAGGSFNTMKCIDLFHSQELDSLSATLSRGGK